MTRIRKERAGSDSFGNTWPKDGAVVDIDPEHVASLLAIPDGGFSEVTPAATEERKDDDGEGPGGDKNPEFSEVDPNTAAAAPEDDEPESKTPAKKTAARKTTTSKPE